jgi:hypothetical protein
MPRTRKLAIVALAAMVLALLVAPQAGASGSGEALVVGDSLADLTSPYLKRYLPRVPLRINAVGGYNTYQIFDLFQESYDPSQSVIVFDAGTNDNPAYPEILAENLEAVAAAIGDRCMVVPTMHGFTVNGIGNDGKNRVAAEFAALRPGTQTPDWAGTVALHPELVQSDGLHPTSEGADYRAGLIAQGVRGCLASMSAPPRQPALESRPELAPVGRIAARRSFLIPTIGAAVARGVALQMARQRPSLAALLAMITIYA